MITDREARMIEIAENLHRHDLKELDRKLQTAEWIILAGQVGEDGEIILAQLAPVSTGGRGVEGGIRAAARELNIDRDNARRSITIANMNPDAREVGRDGGLDLSSAL
jgi:hypothetical protein